MAALLSIVAYFRSRHSQHDFADSWAHPLPPLNTVVKTAGQEGTRIFGRPFVTAGWIVVAFAAIVLVVEVALLVLVLEL